MGGSIREDFRLVTRRECDVLVSLFGLFSNEIDFFSDLGHGLCPLDFAFHLLAGLLQDQYIFQVFNHNGENGHFLLVRFVLHESFHKQLPILFPFDDVIDFHDLANIFLFSLWQVFHKILPNLTLGVLVDIFPEEQ